MGKSADPPILEIILYPGPPLILLLHGYPPNLPLSGIFPFPPISGSPVLLSYSNLILLCIDPFIIWFYSSLILPLYNLHNLILVFFDPSIICDPSPTPPLFDPPTVSSSDPAFFILPSSDPPILEKIPSEWSCTLVGCVQYSGLVC